MATEPKPFDSKDTDPEILRKKTVQAEPKTTFDERTPATPAWLDENGNQRTGAEDLEQGVVDTPDAGESRSEKSTKATTKK